MEQETKLCARRMEMMVARFIVLVLGIWVLWGCRNSAGANPEPLDSGVENGSFCGNVEQDSTDTVFVEELPEPSFSRFGNDIHKVYRNLSDTEMAKLDFDEYQMNPFHKMLLDSWQDYAGAHRPYYSIVKCPSCEQHLLVVYGSTPQEDWESLCGRAGNLAICTHCRKVLDFELVVMN